MSSPTPPQFTLDAELIRRGDPRILFEPPAPLQPMRSSEYLRMVAPVPPDADQIIASYGLSSAVLRPVLLAGVLPTDPGSADQKATGLSTEPPPQPSGDATPSAPPPPPAFELKDVPPMAGAGAAIIQMGVNGTFKLPDFLGQLANGAAPLGKDGAEIAQTLNAVKGMVEGLGVNSFGALLKPGDLDPTLGGLTSGLSSLLGGLGGPEMKGAAEVLGQVASGLNQLGLKASDLGQIGELGDLLTGDAALSDFVGAGRSLGDVALDKLPSLAGALVDKLWAQLPPEVQTALAVGQQLLQALGLPSSFKDMLAAAVAPPATAAAPPGGPPGVYVEGHHIATLTQAFASHDGTPLAPGPGAQTVISTGLPVWRCNVDQHICKVPAPGHGPGSVKVGAKKTWAEGQLIARFGDLLIGEAAPNRIIDAATAARVRAVLAEARAASLSAPNANVGTGGAGQGSGRGGSGAPGQGGEGAEDGKEKKRGPLTREEREARKKEIAERRAREDRAAAPSKEYEGILKQGFDDPNEPMDGGRYLIDSNGELVVDPNLKIGDVLDPNLPERDRAMVYINGMKNLDLNAEDGPLAQGRELARISGRPVVVVFNQAPDGSYGLGFIRDAKSVIDNYREHLGIELPYIDIYQRTPEPSEATLAQLMSATNGKIEVVAHSEGSLLASLAAGSSGKSGIRITTIGGPAVTFPDGVTVVRNADNVDPVAYLSLSGDDQDVDTPYTSPHSALDYFGTNTVRFAGESDAQYERRRARLQQIRASVRDPVTHPRPKPQPTSTPRSQPGPTPTPASGQPARPKRSQTPATKPDPQPGPAASPANTGKANSGQNNE